MPSELFGAAAAPLAKSAVTRGHRDADSDSGPSPRSGLRERRRFWCDALVRNHSLSRRREREPRLQVVLVRRARGLMGCSASEPLDCRTLGQRTGHSSELIKIETRRRALDDFELFKKELGVSQFGSIRKCRARASAPAQQLPPMIRSNTFDLFAMKTVVKSRLRTRDDALREARVMMGLSHHPHVLPLLAVYDEPEQTHFVLRLCSTVTLFDRIPRKPSSRGVEERVARRYLAQIASALEHLHAHSICHRDVKPENCLFDLVATGGDIDAAALRLADFGCARELGPAGARTLVGTIEYAAPELLRQKANYHCGVDVWSAGVVYYVLLCGCYPFADENARALRKQILKAPLDDLLSRLPPLTHRAIAAGDGVEEFKDVDDARADAATAESLVMAMLDRNPKTRIDARGVVAHPLMKEARAGYTRAEAPADANPELYSGDGSDISARV